jgi:thiamine-monophosphate kinase
MRDASSALGVDPYTWILGGGDDHPIVATFPAGTALPDGWLLIGRVLDGSGVTVDGRIHTDGPAGWDHFR